MRYFVRNKILELLPTLQEAINYVNKAEIGQCSSVLNDMKIGLDSIRNCFNGSFSTETYTKYDNVMNEIEQNLQQLKSNKRDNRKTNKEVNRMKELIDILKEKLLQETEVKLEILFIPYKYSMWDSLESIWEASKADPRCNNHVMPIPYYERDENGSLADFKYEIDSFIHNDIPVISYKKFDYTVIRPDVIYYHNPFDEGNRVTSVSPEFYSSQLKNYTSMMVYVPYFVANPIKQTSSELNTFTSTGIKNATKVILQSDGLKKAYKSVGINEDKLFVFGSPKLDAVIKRMDKKYIVNSWEKLKDNKILLLNSTISALLTRENYLLEVRDTIEKVIAQGFSLIWRPHPLLEATISSMRKEDMKEFLNLKEFAKNHPFIQIDQLPDVFSAFQYSDGLITDSKSSIIPSYIMTGKPIFIKDSVENFKKDTFISSDIMSCYFESNFSLDTFLDLVINDRDPKGKERITKFKKSIVNSDGTSGRKIHSYILRELISKNNTISF